MNEERKWDVADLKRVRVIKINGDLLAMVLKLPKNATVVDFSPALYFDEGAWALKIHSPDFSPVKDGMSLPRVDAQYQTGADGVVEFVGWEGDGIGPPDDEADTPTIGHLEIVPDKLGQIVAIPESVFDAKEPT